MSGIVIGSHLSIARHRTRRSLVVTLVDRSSSHQHSVSSIFKRYLFRGKPRENQHQQCGGRRGRARRRQQQGNSCRSCGGRHNDGGSSASPVVEGREWCRGGRWLDGARGNDCAKSVDSGRWAAAGEGVGFGPGGRGGNINDVRDLVRIW